MIKNKTPPVKIYRFKPGDEAKAHPLIEFSAGWEFSDMPGYEDSNIGFPDSYRLKKVEGKCSGFTVDGMIDLKHGDVVVEYADGTYTAMKESLYDSLYEEEK